MVALVSGTSRPIYLRSLGSKQKCTQSAICIWAKNWGLKQISPERHYNIIVYTLRHTNFKGKNIHYHSIQRQTCTCVRTKPQSNQMVLG